MTSSPIDLLKQLGSGVRPDGITPTHARTSIDTANFGQMLDSVRQGQVASERPIVVSGAVADQVKLTDAQLARVATATDAAEAAGVTRMVAVVGGQALTVDVQTRRVEAVGSAASAQLMTGVDAVVFVPDEAESDLAPLFGGDRGGVGGLARGALAGLGQTVNRSVASLIASLTGIESEDADLESAA